MSRLNVKSTAVNSLEYTGIVTLSQYIGGNKVTLAKFHNTGGKTLFNFLANCLIGDFAIAEQNLPTKILLLHEDDEKTLTKASNTGFIYLLAKPELVYSKDAESIVRYSFIIPQDFFTGSSFNAIGLYTNAATETDIEDYAAMVNNISFDTINVSVSSVLALDWELHISN